MVQSGGSKADAISGTYHRRSHAGGDDLLFIFIGLWKLNSGIQPSTEAALTVTGGIDVSPKRHVAGMTRKTPC